MNGKTIVTLVVLLLCVAATIAGVMIVDSGEAKENTNDPIIVENEAPAEKEPEEEIPVEEEKEPEKVKPSIDLDSWNLLLANPDNPLPDDFEVEELVAVQGSFKMDARVAEAMKTMIADAKAEGVDLMICSAYRGIDRQKQLFEAEVANQMNMGKSRAEAEAITATMIAVPGTSEHHTGLAADIVTPTHQTLDPQYMDTAAGQWLFKNAADYGFILRYPEDKQEITQIIYESWHYRYVGEEHAKTIMEQGLCLEEYLEQVKEGKA